ncbi:PRC-barrel domain-containing protein [Cyanobium gracile]|uniref:PRC-barrel domain-containing protein n=1 Tax=Cyanobium gracile UHCC 0281 TaxID=3110309 RepID=A0ABU5SZR0_9CYAN|nr:PRC-barrel domain-containing protein [Cyanobium gracile]MEA5444008.1 PRC-barrel domain-containing protein [Cyanobium gracile UHCC 0281]
MTSPIPPSTEPAASSDRLWLRSELMGTQVITRDTGRRLGVVGEVVVDIDRREVVALGLRDNPLTRFLPGLPRWMPLDRIRQVGDVILVDSVDSLAEGFNPERYSKVINCQVITESGEQLGRVLGFSFDIETGELTTLVIGALGVPLLGEGVLSTWEMPVGEVVSSGPDRIIVYEGAEEKLKQLGTGLLEKLGIGGASWEQEERDRFRTGAVPAENQLPAGQPTAQEQRRIQPATSRSFQPSEELEYVELEERREREPLRQRRYLDDDLPEPRQRPEPRPAPADPYGQDRERNPARYDNPYVDERYEDERYDRERYRDERSFEPETYRAPVEAPGRDFAEPEREREPLRAERPQAPAPRPKEPVDVEPEILDDPW